MLDLNQLIDNAARALIRSEQDDSTGLMWGHRYAGLTATVASRVGGLFPALTLIGERIADIEDGRVN
jgi:hypothetical protein